MSAPAAAGPAEASLAERIFVELIGRSYLRVENAAVFKPDAAQLAKLSIDLATEFEKAAVEHRAQSGPKNVGYDAQSMDLGTISLGPR